MYLCCICHRVLNSLSNAALLFFSFGLARSGSLDSFPQVVFSFQICYLKKLKCISYIRDIELEPDTSKVVKNFKH